MKQVEEQIKRECVNGDKDGRDLERWGKGQECMREGSTKSERKKIGVN